ncbi:class I SAM-dependent methyltransferase [Vibrio aerogenes]|uniref:class I SAM-dependent methyltransferase n=1 Tax=Vibrio aerogenes TaxID=92172 RepID=UPI0021C3119C|nr:DUF4942 domain-containing protein [Vibrio aerogenes]
MSVTALVQQLKSSNQDFEWYPTTDEMLDCIHQDLFSTYCCYARPDDKVTCSVLDIGAGNGKALNRLTEGKKFAIEKSKPLLNTLDKDIFVVGTDFHQQTLIDKKVDVIFCNPPYSEYKQWVMKVIAEANAETIYFVIPSRWSEDADIENSLSARSAEAEVMFSGDFSAGERQARAKIEIVKVRLTRQNYSIHRRQRCIVDPFSIWFEQHFQFDAKRSEHGSRDLFSEQKLKQNVAGASELIRDQGFVSTLESLYNRDMDKLIHTYLKLNEVDAMLLDELNVSIEGIQKALKQKITSLKDLYWKELFHNLDTITGKLCVASRERLLKTLFAYTHVDFNAENAHAVVIWCIKNANQYFDSQLIDLVERMTEKANIALYRSNQKTFGEEDWRYCRTPKQLDRYKLDYRVVMTRTGGIFTSDYFFEKRDHNLSDSATDFINDLLTVAQNLGFDTSATPKAQQRLWESNKKQAFSYDNHSLGQEVVLFEAKAFKNGNMHIKFNQDFIMRLNVEFGRLKGWLKSAGHAGDELEIEAAEAVHCFQSNLQLTHHEADLPKLIAA